MYNDVLLVRRLREINETLKEINEELKKIADSDVRYQSRQEDPEQFANDLVSGFHKAIHDTHEEEP